MKKYEGLEYEQLKPDTLETIIDEIRNKRNFSNQELKDLIEDFTSLLSMLGYIEKQYQWMNEGQKLDRDDKIKYGVLGRMQEYLKNASNLEIQENAEKILINEKDFSYQYDFEEYPNRTRSELLANVMDLSNVTAHIIITDEFKENIKNENKNIYRIIRPLFNLKDNCIKELIKCKQKGENIEINRTQIGSEETYTIIIPEYFEAFSVHGRCDLDEEQLKQCNDPKYFVDGMKSTLPFKITKEKHELLEYLYLNGNIKSKDLMQRIELYLKTQERLKQKAQKKEEEKAVQGKEYTGKDTKIKESLQNKEKNKEFIGAINQKLGQIFTEENIDDFIQRANYSFENLYEKKLKNLIYEKLDYIEVPEEKKEEEALKVFVYLRINKNISMINSGAINKENLETLIDDSILEYQKAFEYLESLKGKNASYADIKKEIKLYMNNGQKQKRTRRKNSTENKEQEQKSTRRKKDTENKAQEQLTQEKTQPEKQQLKDSKANDVPTYKQNYSQTNRNTYNQTNKNTYRQNNAKKDFQQSRNPMESDTTQNYRTRKKPKTKLLHTK